ncbi:hypothetical protein TTHERM_00895830 (macronuclear) [Tetrahymena thermophila SB210]|uniref:Uncharacterized protein n=1 Tax=Tetrahymena thermophila (strain SB210) TaxID=312017 RepID=Q22E44_TETTS|nr:hypothetical protein TTHERM_00895830 [Tetrahymena thermophila SB210]EAR83570.1 hypothetical protein TTHERM_00895830 [Tetrahymena thermophila SB210]|eukprot:XP_001031233.1 hypothetical protein TTHERM_00895830 [Tetrahymena thermophila SB210]
MEGENNHKEHPHVYRDNHKHHHIEKHSDKQEAECNQCDKKDQHHNNHHHHDKHENKDVLNKH